MLNFAKRLITTVLSVMALWLLMPENAAGQINHPETVLLQPAGCSQPCVGMATVTGLCHGDYDFNWSNGSTDSIATGLCPGTYSVTITPAHGGCICGVLTIEVPASFLTCWTWNTPVECLTKGTASVDADYGTPPYTYLWSNGKTTATINNLFPGQYTVTVTDANHCTSTCETWVEDYSHPLTVSISAPVIACGATTTTATATTSNGVFPYAYLWNTGATTATINNVTPGTYKVTMTDANGCTGTASKVILAPSQPTATIVTTNTHCGENNGQVSLTTNGAWSVKWSGPGGFTATGTGPITTITNLVTGAYTATVTNTNGCSIVQTVFVEDSEKPKSIFICKTLCQPDSVNGIWVSSVLDSTYTAYDQNCPYEVHLQVMFATADTTNAYVFACYGDTVKINGLNYTQTTTVTTQVSGVCIGLAIWNIEFSDPPTYIPFPLIKICGGDSAQTHTLSWPVVPGNCPSLIATRDIEITPYTFIANPLGTEIVCGLEERTDTIGFPTLHVNNTTCTITYDYSLLHTVLPTQDSVYQDTARCGIIDTVETQLKSISTNLDSCKQTLLFLRTTYTKATESTEYFQVCDSTDQIYWHGAMRSVGVSAFLDEDSCMYRILEVSLRPHIPLTKQVSICPGEQFTFKGISYGVGTWTIILSGIGTDCDTTMQLTVSERVTVTFPETFTVCPGDQKIYHGQPYGKGVWEVTLPSQSSNECDTLVTLVIMERENKDIFVPLQACAGDSALYNGHYYPAGLHFTSLPSQSNDECDTIVTIFVSQLFAPDSTITLPSCKASLQDSIVIKATPQGCAYKVTYEFPWEPLQNDSINIITSCNDSIGHLPHQFVIITENDGCDRGMWIIYTFKTEKEDIVEWTCDGTALDTAYTVVDPVTKCVTDVTYHRYVKPKVSLTSCHSICWGSPWMMPNGTTVLIKDTVTYVQILPGVGNECDTTVTVTVSPIFSDVITLTLAGVCDSLLSGTKDSILQGNSCPILLHLVTPWLGKPNISLKVDSVSCPGNNGQITALISGGSGNYDLAWSVNGQKLPDVDTMISGLSGGYYSVTAFDMQTGCEATAEAEVLNPGCAVPLDTLPCRWRVYPNPVKVGNPSYLELEGWNGEIELTWITPDGHAQTTSSHDGTGRNQVIQLNTPPTAGVWLLNMKLGKKKTSAKIIVN